MTSVSGIKSCVRWHWDDRYGDEVANAIQEVVAAYPDAQQLAQEAQEMEKMEKAAQKMKKKEFQEKLQQISAACFKAVESVTRPADKSSFLYKPFNQLPWKNVHIVYYKVIPMPISLSNIHSKVNKNIYDSVD
ncbi:hypothetical protein D9758_004282 [Tetrapyrgos nigripes]|uniref:Bromo domain-containing protein n=1 Tax=Tetrapyrgos nigripes TaxID=182062 RepID=A0A8H5GUB4_9AGAR|nr:hypothetical protein D9758_004282 [Tetrapyrgos nigripes]